MEKPEKTPAQIKREAKRLEKLAKFQAKQEKLAGQKMAKPKTKHEKAAAKAVIIMEPTMDKDGKKGV